MTTNYPDFDSLHNIAPGKHFYQFYKNTEDYLRVMMAYFQSGLDKGDACLWLVSETKGVENVIDFASQMIPRFMHCMASRQMVIQSAESWYRPAGRFDMNKALTNAQRHLEKILQAGYRTLRISGDAAANAGLDYRAIEAYESRVDSVIKTLPIIALCAYPIQDCSITETKVIVDHHDDVLIGRL